MIFWRAETDIVECCRPLFSLHQCRLTSFHALVVHYAQKACRMTCCWHKHHWENIKEGTGDDWRWLERLNGEDAWKTPRCAGDVWGRLSQYHQYRPLYDSHQSNAGEGPRQARLLDVFNAGSSKLSQPEPMMSAAPIVSASQHIRTNCAFDENSLGRRPEQLSRLDIQADGWTLHGAPRCQLQCGHRQGAGNGWWE